MKIKLIAKTENAARVIAIAAKTCYAAEPISELEKNLTDKEIEKFVKMLKSLGHESPFEHASFTFIVEGVSRSLLAQLTRHRIASYSVRSQRYVNEGNESSYVVPKDIRDNDILMEKFEIIMDTATKAYNSLHTLLKDQYIAEGMKVAAAEKMANENARAVLPNAWKTNLVFTMNTRALYNFFDKRCCRRAQGEIQELAMSMLYLLQKEVPILFDNVGPKCLTQNKCGEGKMTCGNPYTNESITAEVGTYIENIAEEMTNTIPSHTTYSITPPIITLSGSTKFKDEFIRVRDELQQKIPCVVLMPDVFNKADNPERILSEEEIEELDTIHRRKIDICGFMVVINKDNYLGESTKKEIQYAVDQNKTVSYLEYQIKDNDTVTETINDMVIGTRPYTGVPYHTLVEALSEVYNEIPLPHYSFRHFKYSQGMLEAINKQK